MYRVSSACGLVALAAYFCVARNFLRVLFLRRHYGRKGDISGDVDDDEDTDVLLNAEWESHASDSLV